MTTSKIVPTDEQLAFMDAARGRDSVMGEAYAGTAKSTTLQLASQGIRVPTLALAFNTANTKDLKGRFPGNFKVQSLNGLGFAALMRALPDVRFEIDDRKLGKLVSQVAKDQKVELSEENWDAVRQLASKARGAGIVPGGSGQELTADSSDEWKLLSDDLGIPEDDFGLMYELAHEVLAENNRLTLQGKISFDDQVYASVCIAGRYPQFPKVMVDESQDLNGLNHQQVARACRSDGQLIVVGDSRQGLYLFRGAHSRSMEQLRGLRPNWIDAPLRTSFRCPQIVVSRQQHHAPGFKAWNKNPVGRFDRIGRVSADDVDAVSYRDWTWSDFREAAPELGQSRAILCRNNAPLLALAFRLIRQGIGPVMLGRDIGKGLKQLAKRLAPEARLPAETIGKLVLEWRDSEVVKAEANGKSTDSFEDRAGCLLTVLDNVRDSQGLWQALDRLFAREHGDVTLGSIHKAKGKEWDTVLHLDPWRIRRRPKMTDDQWEQELNALYVLETRTKHTLLSADLDGFK